MVSKSILRKARIAALDVAEKAIRHAKGDDFTSDRDVAALAIYSLRDAGLKIVPMTKREIDEYNDDMYS